MNDTLLTVLLLVIAVMIGVFISMVNGVNGSIESIRREIESLTGDIYRATLCQADIDDLTTKVDAIKEQLNM